MLRTLDAFIGSTMTAARKNDAAWTTRLRGQAFKWVSYKGTGAGGTSGSMSSWSEKNAFFCDGTFEVTTFSESSYSGQLSGGGYYSGASSSNGSELGDVTVLQTATGPVLAMLSANGVQAAPLRVGAGVNSPFFGDQEFSPARPNRGCPAAP
jgi:hypothetical protein